MWINRSDQLTLVIVVLAALLSGCGTPKTYRAPGMEKLLLQDLAVVVRGSSADIGLYFEKLDGRWIKGPNRLEITPGKHELQATIKYAYPGSQPALLRFDAQAGKVYEVFFATDARWWHAWIVDKETGAVVGGSPKPEHRRFYK